VREDKSEKENKFEKGDKMEMERRKVGRSSSGKSKDKPIRLSAKVKTSTTQKRTKK